MIDNRLPAVDTVGGHEKLEHDTGRDPRHRRTLLAAAAAALLVAAAGALLLNRGSGGAEVTAAPPAGLPDRVFYFGDDGSVSFVADDGSRRAFPAKNVDRLAFSPNGEQVAYTTFDENSGARSLWIADHDGTSPRGLDMPCTRCMPGFGVTWSNDSTRLAYSVFTPGARPAQLRIRTIATADEQVFRMPAGFDARGPRFSPDDQSLVLNLAGEDGEYVATLDLAETASPPTRLSDAYNQVQVPSWSADGRTVYFTATTSGENTKDVDASIDLFAVDADGRDLRQITHAAPGERFLAASVYRGRFLISRAQGADPWVIGWLSSDGSTFTPMRNGNGRPFLGSIPLLQP